MLNDETAADHEFCGQVLKKHFDVRKSPIQGNGLFITINVPANTRLIKLAGKVFRHKYDSALSSLNQNWIGIGPEKWLQLYSDNNAVYINHSCEPNVIIDPHLNVISIKHIEANEELLLDYSTTELDPYWKMKCSCGRVNCRNAITGFQFLPSRLQEYYASYLAEPFVNAMKVHLIDK